VIVLKRIAKILQKGITKPPAGLREKKKGRRSSQVELLWCFEVPSEGGKNVCDEKKSGGSRKTGQRKTAWEKG